MTKVQLADRREILRQQAETAQKLIEEQRRQSERRRGENRCSLKQRSLIVQTMMHGSERMRHERLRLLLVVALEVQWRQLRLFVAKLAAAADCHETTCVRNICAS